MNYGAVLSRAWHIIWKYKVLWIFGILSGCTNFHGEPGSNSRITFENQWPASFERFFNNMPDWQFALLVALIIVALFGLVLVAIFLTTIGRVGLVRGTVQADSGLTHLSFSELFSGSLPYFWRVFGLNLLIGIILFSAVVGAIIFGTLTTVLTFGVFLICLIPSLCLLIPLWGIIDAWVIQANIAIIVDDVGIIEALGRSWRLITKNLGPIIVMVLILTLGFSFIGGLLIGLPFFGIFGATAWRLYQMGGLIDLSSVWVGLLLMAIYLPIFILLIGVLRSYIDAAWTLTYLRLTGRTGYVEPAPVEPQPATPSAMVQAPGSEPPDLEPLVVEAPQVEAAPAQPQPETVVELPPAPPADEASS